MPLYLFAVIIFLVYIFWSNIKRTRKARSKENISSECIPVQVIKENKTLQLFSYIVTSITHYKKNYRPISILPILSKVYERLIYNQMYPYFDKLFSKFQCGFRKGFNAQHCLITMIKKMAKVSWWRCSSNWYFYSFWLYWPWIINSKTFCLRFW